MVQDENDTRCSFCGETGDGELAEGGGQDAGGLPEVRICWDCAQACVESLRTERRISEARSSRPPVAMNDAAAEELGQIVAWTPFTMDGRPLEWSAQRSVHTELVVHVSVRNPETGRSVAVALRGEQVPTVEDAMMAASASSDVLEAETEPEISQVVNQLTDRDLKR